MLFYFIFLFWFSSLFFSYLWDNYRTLLITVLFIRTDRLSCIHIRVIIIIIITIIIIINSLLGITRQLSRVKFAIFVLTRYWTQLLVPVPPECWIFKMASLCYFLVSSYRSALFALSKCYLGSISSFLICPPAAEHTLQRNMKENSRRGLKTNTTGSACLQEKAWKL